MGGDLESAIIAALGDLGEGVAVVDGDGRVSFANAAWEQILGYTPEELYALPSWAELVASHDRERIWDDVTARLGDADTREVLVADFVHKAGHLVKLEGTVAPLERDRRTRLIAVARDITAVRRERDYYETLLSAWSDAGQAFSVIDPDGRIAYANPAWERISGYSAGELYSLPSWVELVPEHDRERIRAEVARRASGEAAREPFEALMLDKAGRLVWLEGVVAPVEREGRIQLIVLARDVSARREIEERLRYQRGVLEAQAEATIDGILVVSPDRRVLSYNRRFLEIWGLPEELAEAGDSRAALEAVTSEVEDPEDFRERVRWLYEHPEESARDEIRLRDGRTIDRYSAPVRDAEGHPLGRIWVFRDITDVKRTEERLTFLAGASAVLDASLDPETTLRSVTRLFVPRLADACNVVLLRPDGTLERHALAAATPELEHRIQALVDALDIDPASSHPVAEVVRSGRAMLVAEIPEEALRSASPDERHLLAVREIGIRSGLIAPLSARGRTLGALVLTSAREHRYGPDDLALVEDVARRAALAYDNARLYEERSHVASTLQASLLPERLPEIPGIELASLYRPARVDGDVGGDFYDAFETDGGWTLVIGDVCGKGAEAAALTGLARHTIRTAAMADASPVNVLAVLNEAILRQGTDFRFCTVALVDVRVTGNGAVAVVACGGHPRPLLLAAGRGPEAVPCRGAALGIWPEASASQHEVTLHRGDALVLYTDGLSEARHNGGLLGEEGVRRLVAEFAGGSATDIAHGVESRLLAMGLTLRDDVAALVARVPG